VDVRRIVGDALADRYVLGGDLGHGGMAVVYRAEPVAGGPSVAIKVLRPEIARFLGAARFEREVRILAALHHPRIVSLSDFGVADAIPYLVMPFVEGETLRQRLDRVVSLSLADAVAVVRGVAEALDYAHAQRVVHRDIKPENILLGDHGAMVLDFGLARAVEVAGGDSLSSSGIAIGTPPYMSPEQAAATRTVDGRTDLYALGCVLFEMLTGDLAFSGPSAQAVLARHLAESPRRVTVVRPDLPARLDDILAHVLQKDPAARPPTGAAFVTLLESVRDS